MKKTTVIISYIIIYLSLLFIYVIVVSLFLKLPPSESFPKLIQIIPFALIYNLIQALILLAAGNSFLHFLELHKARNAYENARNRIGFIKDGQIVCFEGEIGLEDGQSPLLSPISQQACVLYCYGNKFVGGGTSQTRSVIKPSGETIYLNGWLSGEYVEEKEYDPQKENLQHLFSFMSERKDSTVEIKDVTYAPFFYNIAPNTNPGDAFENHKIISTLDETEFKKNKFTEIVIPDGIYGWVLGKWDEKNRQLLPLNFSMFITVIQKDYKMTFLQYVSDLRLKVFFRIVIAILITIMMSLPILAPVIMGNSKI